MRETPRGAPIMRDGTISATRDKVDRSTVELLTVCVSNSLGTSPGSSFRPSDAIQAFLVQRTQFRNRPIIHDGTPSLLTGCARLKRAPAVQIYSRGRGYFTRSRWRVRT